MPTMLVSSCCWDRVVCCVLENRLSWCLPCRLLTQKTGFRNYRIAKPSIFSSVLQDAAIVGAGNICRSLSGRCYCCGVTAVFVLSCESSSFDVAECLSLPLPLALRQEARSSSLRTPGSVSSPLMTTEKNTVGGTPCRCSSRISRPSRMLPQLPRSLAFKSRSPTAVATRQLWTVHAACVDTIAAFVLVVVADITCTAEMNEKRLSDSLARLHLSVHAFMHVRTRPHRAYCACW